jgi:hypothetical protein
VKPLAPQPTLALFVALCPQQLAALIRADWRRIEPGRGGEHFIYLKLNQRYAEMMARQWELPLHGSGYVARIVLPQNVLSHYDLETVAYDEHLEYRVPVCELEHINAALVGEVQVVAAFLEQHAYSVPPGSRPLAGMLQQ